jgi:hypothetical protein
MSEHAIDFPVHQEDDVVAGRRLATIGFLAVIIGAIGVLLGALVVYEVTGSIRPNASGPGGPRPGPTAIAHVLQTPIWDTEAGIDRNRRQRAELERLGWVNREGGMARIPIEAAMDLVADGTSATPSRRGQQQGEGR